MVASSFAFLSSLATSILAISLFSIKDVKIFDVRWSGEREPSVDGKLPKIGETVDVNNTTWTNTGLQS